MASIPQEQYVDIQYAGQEIDPLASKLSVLERRFDAHIGKGGNVHASATPQEAGFMSPEDKIKLDGVETGATQNSTDAFLLNRGNHQGEQPIESVTGLRQELDDALAGGSNYRGLFPSLTALQDAIPVAVAGNYADVDEGEGVDAVRYIWDESDQTWVSGGTGEPLTAPQVKALYEANPNTNPFTDQEKQSLNYLFSSLVSSYGAIGDGISDDTNSILAAISSANPGGFIVFDYGKNYRITGQIPIDKPIEIDLNSSTLSFEFGSSLSNGCGFQVQSSNVKIENGTIRITGEPIGAASSAHVPVYGGREDTGEGWENLVFRNLRLFTNGNGGIVFMGENRNVLVENIIIEDSAGIRLGVAFEWGGTPTVGTGHPHNIVIRNIKAGRFTYPGPPADNYTCVVWVSSVFNVRIENIFAEEVPTVVNIFTGDKSNVYAPETYKDMVGANISVDGVACESVTGYGVRVYGKGTDSPTPLAQNANIKNLKLKAAPSLVNTHMGALLEFCDGVVLENFSFDGFYYGLVTGADVKDMLAQHGEILNSQFVGAQIGSTGLPAINPTVRNVLFRGNNKQNTSGIDTASAIRITDSKDALIDNCRFGSSDAAETQMFSIYASSASLRPRLNNNHTEELKSGGVAYVIGEAQSQTFINASGDNNTVKAGLTPVGGAPIFTISSNGQRHFVASGIPISGSFSRGDKLYYDSPSASGFIGAVCVTAGSPGTWRNFGNISS
ncbi:MAG: pectate lyase superfamily protein [Caudoviricetes sp.]|nr:MAG: pectate lyase superfamily protein [Caudoviricetes sp.]